MEDVELRDFANDQQTTDDQTPTGKERWWSFKRLWTDHIRITIDEGDCRDHLALERTYLAYIRTASAYAQFGVTIAQLFRLNVDSTGATRSTTLTIGKALGATVEGIAIIVMLLGAGYFAKQQIRLMKGAIIGRGYEIYIMVLVSLVLLVILLALLAAADKW